MKKLMIYGATGYTRRTTSTYAREAGIDIIIAGRDGAALADLALIAGQRDQRLIWTNPDSRHSPTL